MSETYKYGLKDLKGNPIPDSKLSPIGRDMFERRGGWEYYKKYKAGRKMVYQTGYISAVDYYYTLAVQIAVSIMPNKVRGFVFKKLLHH